VFTFFVMLALMILAAVLLQTSSKPSSPISAGMTLQKFWWCYNWRYPTGFV